MLANIKITDMEIERIHLNRCIVKQTVVCFVLHKTLTIHLII